MAGEFDANRELEGESELAPLEEFLEQISLVNEQDDLIDDETQITLMTLHNAKGLEYRAVFIIGCEDGVFPHSRSIDEGSLEEERRLCYVGLTRARERLDADLRAPPQHLRLAGDRDPLALPRRDPDRARRAPLDRVARRRDRLGDGRLRPLGIGRVPGRARARPGARAGGRRRRRPRGLRRGRRHRGRAGQRRSSSASAGRATSAS